MCGRFANAIQSRDLVPQLQRHYPDLRVERWADDADQERWRPRYNIPPRSNVPVLRRENGEHVVRVMNWSLVPGWSKHEPQMADRLRTINARSEALTGEEERSPLWNNLAPSKRCIIPVQGFYEWLTKGKGPAGKAPYYTRNPDPASTAEGGHAKAEDVPPLMFAGLWESVTYEETDVPLLTFTILTTAASPALSFLHTRMPVLLRSQEDMRAWLDCEPVPPALQAQACSEGRNVWTQELGALCRPFGRKGAGDLACYAVPQEVGKVGNDAPSFVLPVADRKDGIDTLFKAAFAKGAKAVPEGKGAGKGAKEGREGAEAKGKAKAKEEVKQEVKQEGKGKGKEVVLSEEDDEVIILDSSPDVKPKKRKSLTSPTSPPAIKPAASSSPTSSMRTPPPRTARPLARPAPAEPPRAAPNFDESDLGALSSSGGASTSASTRSKRKPAPEDDAHTAADGKAEEQTTALGRKRQKGKITGYFARE